MDEGERDWAKLLEYFYIDQPTYEEPPSRLDNDQLSYIARNAGIDPSEQDHVRDVIESMRRVGLFGQEERGEVAFADEYGLTRKGFDVAHQRQLAKRQQSHEEDLREQQLELQRKLFGKQNELTRRLTYFTGLLVIAAGIQALGVMRVVPTSDLWILTIAILSALVIGFAMGTLLTPWIRRVIQNSNSIENTDSGPLGKE